MLSVFNSAPTVVIPGFTSRNSPMRFASITAFKLLTPVILPPGRLRLATNPPTTGSPMNTATIGVVLVAVDATFAVMSPPTDTSTVCCGQKITSLPGQALVMTVCPAVVDGDILPFDYAVFGQTFA